MNNALLALLPLLLTAVVPVVVTNVRRWSDKHIPPRYIPVLLPVVGGVLGAAANFFGVDAEIIQTLGVTSHDPNVWETVVIATLTAATGNNVHQIVQATKKE